MISVRDVGAALAWYESIGFKVINSFADDGVLNFGMVQFGNAQIMMRLDAEPSGGTSLWFYTEQIDDLYAAFQKRQSENGLPGMPTVEFSEPINDTFYNARQFGICEPNGYTLYFIRSLPADGTR
jgi:Glyoxalase/Bleomycin resistance protein/Dioxygenase superfamily